MATTKDLLEPAIMRDPAAAKAYVKAGGIWSQKCVMELCPTIIQGGEAGMIAHLGVVHKIKPKLPQKVAQ